MVIAAQARPTQLSAFLEELAEGLRRRPDRSPYLVTCDSARSFGLPQVFGDLDPPHLDVGVREGTAVSVAAGLAAAGHDPFVACFAAFGLLRGAEALRTYVSGEGAPVTLLAGMAGLSAARDGVSHHCLEDLAVLRGMPAIRIYAPSDVTSVRWIVEDLLSERSPAYVRLVRHAVADTQAGDGLGGFRHLRRAVDGAESGRDVVVGFGPSLAAALPALDTRAGSYDVIEVQRLNPLPAGLGTHLGSARRIAVVEEHLAEGGLADRLRLTCPRLASRITGLAVPRDPGSGTYPGLLEAAGLVGGALLARLDSVFLQTPEGQK
ncbi:hypothetical protein ACFY1U_47925 [Streptomyces sp. NPDC001351]|uniref:hypothetical protein n=1 Tax=Streptomyces sp. NPDC001351 TaxID=3364564 RepID=UPI00367D0EF5